MKTRYIFLGKVRIITFKTAHDHTSFVSDITIIITLSRLVKARSILISVYTNKYVKFKSNNLKFSEIPITTIYTDETMNKGTNTRVGLKILFRMIIDSFKINR